MKKPLILAVAAITLAAGAQAESKFYGKMNVSTSYDDSSEALALTSNASRLGVKGSDDIGSTKVIYQAEFELAVDDGYGTDVDEDDGTDTDTDTNTLKPRDTYVGLSYGDMGTVKMGIMDTPLKKSQGKFDLFNDVIDMKNVLDGENRLGNSVNYTTAKMGAVQASVTAVLGEGSSDGYSASVVFKEGDIYAAVAFDTNLPGKETETFRATAIYTMGDMRFGALINNVDTADTAAGGDELGFALNASMKMGKNTAKVQFESGDQKTSGATNIKAGADHKLAKATKAFAYVSQFDNDAGDAFGFSIGLEHKF